MFQKSLRSAGWSSLDYTVVPILWLLATPFFIRSLGVEEYGIWMLVNAFVGFSGIATLGLGDATVRSVARHTAAGEMNAVHAVVRTTSGLCLLLGLLFAILTWWLSPLLAVNMFSVSGANTDLSIASFRVGALAVVVRLLDVVPTAVLQGFERFDLSAKIRIPFSVLGMLVNVTLVAMGHSIVMVIFGSTAVLAAGIVVKIVVARVSLLPGVRFFAPGPIVLSTELRGLALSSWLQSLSGIMVGQVDRLLVASFLGTGALTYYAVCVQFSQQIHSLLSQALSFLLPLASVRHERHASRSIRRIYFTSTNLTVMAAVGIGIPVFMLSHEILELWMDTSFADKSAELLRMFVVVFTLLSTSIVPHYVMNATGYYRLNAILSCSGGAVAALASLSLIPAFGLLGAALSRLVTLPLSIVGRTVVHFKVLDDRRWFSALPIFLPLIAVFVLLHVLETTSLMSVLEGPAKLVAVSLFTIAGVLLVGSVLLMVNQGHSEKITLSETSQP